MLRKNWQNLDIFMSKMWYLCNFDVMWLIESNICAPVLLNLLNLLQKSLKQFGSKPHILSFSPTRLINSIKQEYSCKILYVGLVGRNMSWEVWEQQRGRPACTSAQSDQSLFYSLFGRDHIWACCKCKFNFLASLCSWGDWFETRFDGNPKDRFSRDVAHMGYNRALSKSLLISTFRCNGI